MAAMELFESTVTETLTSEVEAISTGQRWLAKTSNIFLTNRCAMSIRVATTSTTVMRFLAAMALKIFLLLGAVAVMRVPSHLDCESSESAPEYSSGWPAAAWLGEDFRAEISKLRRFFKADVLMRRASGQRFGSVVIMLSTSVQISIRSAFSPAPTMAALKSDLPRPSVAAILRAWRQ